MNPPAGFWLALFAANAALPCAVASAQSIEELRGLSIEELADVDISSVSKAREALSDAPAAVFVITREDIARSAATTIPELLRLAPNLQVAQTSASGYVITARGLSGNDAAQNFTNKLLVLIDGRSAYTPLYSGVYWDMQDVVLSDIDRIEVISGPGATLWGANAVNGVINIITRRAAATQGLLAEATGGARERSGSLRYGMRLGEQVTARLYVRGIDADGTRSADGQPDNDSWHRIQGGFRLGWTPGEADLVTIQGDAYGATVRQPGAAAEDLRGANIMARWTRTATNGDALQVQGYYDHTQRATPADGGRLSLDTLDLDVQQGLSLGAAHDLVVGGGVRRNLYHLTGTETLSFDPPGRTLMLANVFAQDSIALTPRLRLTAGLKLEREPYVGVAVLPNVRLSWKPVEDVLLWSAVSRAVRAPTPFDRDVVEKIDGQPFVLGSDSFRTEKLTAFEAGARVRATSRASLSLSAYYNLYDDLRSVELDVARLVLSWGNGLRGHSWGLEAWGNYAPVHWWRLSAGFNLLREDFAFKPGASGLLGVSQLGNDPRHQATLRSSMNLGRDLSLDADFRYVGPRPDPRVPGYAELGGKIGWRAARHLLLSLSAQNLLHDYHQEYPAPANLVPRRVFMGAQWRW